MRLATDATHRQNCASMSSDSTASLPYHEPSIETLLILSSFIILLNAINWIVDKWLFCGLVGQILIGVAWGAPGGQLLASDTEKAIVELGYIGLILLVFEGSSTHCGYGIPLVILLTMLQAACRQTCRHFGQTSFCQHAWP